MFRALYLRTLPFATLRAIPKDALTAKPTPTIAKPANKQSSFHRHSGHFSSCFTSHHPPSRTRPAARGRIARARTHAPASSLPQQQHRSTSARRGRAVGAGRHQQPPAAPGPARPRPGCAAAAPRKGSGTLPQQPAGRRAGRSGGTAGGRAP